MLTFNPHPSRIVNPDDAPPMLTSDDEKRRAIRETEPNGLLELPFTEELSRHEPHTFITQLTRAIPTLRAFVVGPDWRFGQGATGSVDLLALIGEEKDFEVIIAPPLHWDGMPVSSTRIRQAIAAGNFEAVEQMLGRPYALAGEVVPGRQVGRQLGFPTANIVPVHGVLPPHGVFAVKVDIDGRMVSGAAYYGHRSAHPEQAGQYFFEVYLFDFDADLYGRHIVIQIVAYIRPDRRFDSEDALKRQIEADTVAVREILAAQTTAVESEDVE